MSTVYGYARISTSWQNLATQRQPLRQYDENIKLVEDKSTGRNKDREGLNKLMDTLQEGNTVVIKGFKSIYWYTSDSDGIRHAHKDTPNFSFEDAQFMLITCSAFCNYLIEKANKVGINLS